MRAIPRTADRFRSNQTAALAARHPLPPVARFARLQPRPIFRAAHRFAPVGEEFGQCLCEGKDAEEHGEEWRGEDVDEPPVVGLYL